ncbi:MAG: glycosyltransferase family 4 protein [Candidatus Magasanikbacteria bacterium]
MKRTLIISLEFPPQLGGIATYVEKLAGTLDTDKIIVLAPPTEEKDHDAKYPYMVVRKDFYFPKFIWPRWIKLLFIVRKLVKEYNIENIHVHHILPVGYVAWYMKKFSGVKYVLFSHGTDIEMASKVKRKNKFATKVGRGAEQIIVNSESLGIRLKAKFPELAEKVTVMYPCPDTDFMIPPSVEEVEKLRSTLSLEGKKVLLSIGRLDEGKGFPYLVRYLPQILKKVPNLVWIVVGQGPKEKLIIELIRKNNLQNIVRFIGGVPHDDLKKYYYLADIFALLTHPDITQGEEGLGLVFLEASAVGMPIIAGKSGGVEEAVLNGKTGIVVESNNETEVVEALSTLIENTELAKQLGANAKQRIQQEFDWKAQLKKIETWL